MIQIAICDDDPDDRATLLALTRRHLSEHGVEAEVTAFAHPDALLTAIEARTFHLYLLDIVMPMVSGLELGQEIRRGDREAQIVYVTTEPQFALRAYAAQPIAYLVKPIDPERLSAALALAIERADVAQQRTFPVRTADSLRVLRTQRIACCEYHQHAAVFVLSNGERVFSRTFRENFADYCADMLRDCRFVQCHAAFIVNLRHVERFCKDSFTLSGGHVVPIAEKRYPAVRDAYLDYLASVRC